MKYIFVVLGFLSSLAWAIDNPDAPDYVAEFEARISPLEKYTQEEAMTTLDWSKGYSELERTLDSELNAAYKILMEKLPETSRESLRTSQRAWLNYRDSEFEFIATNFTREEFGTSYVISLGSYRSSIIKSRVKELLGYLKNYS